MNIDLDITKNEAHYLNQNYFDDSFVYFKTVNNKIERCHDERYEYIVSTLVQIEEFVLDVITSTEPAFRQHPNKKIFLPNFFSLAKYFKQMVRLAEVDPSAYIVSEWVDLFYTCWNELGLFSEMPMSPMQYSPRRKCLMWEIFNDLIALIRLKSNTPEFKRRVSRRREKSKHNQQSGENYIDALLDRRCTRLLVLRLDFSYLANCGNEITVESAKRDLKRFLRGRHNAPLIFDGWIGYLWKLEWGPEKKCHFHLLIFFDGIRFENDYLIAKNLGEHWRKLTKGRGIYWNCNANKSDYHRLGIGKLDIHDQQMRRVLFEDVLSYMTKSEQHLRAKALGPGHCFDHGEMPPPRTTTRGRPRRID